MLVRQRLHQIRGHVLQPRGREKSPRHDATPCVQMWQLLRCSPPPASGGSDHLASASTTCVCKYPPRLPPSSLPASPPPVSRRHFLRRFLAPRSSRSAPTSAACASASVYCGRASRLGCARLGPRSSSRRRLMLRAATGGLLGRGTMESSSPRPCSTTLFAAMFRWRWSSYALRSDMPSIDADGDATSGQNVRCTCGHGSAPLTASLSVVRARTRARRAVVKDVGVRPMG